MHPRPSAYPRPSVCSRPGPWQCSRSALLLLLALSVCGGSAVAHAPHDKFNRIAVSPDFAQDGMVFAFAELIDQFHFARSTDRGRNWTMRLLPMAQYDIAAFAFSPAFANDGSAFCATGNGVYRSTDRGLSWQPVNAGLTQLSCTGMAISPDYANDATLLLSTVGGAFRSTDGGDFWQPANVGLTEVQLGFVAFGPPSAGAPSAFIGGTRVHRSDDLGQTWVAEHDFGDAIASLAVSPTFAGDGTVVAALSSSGVHASANGGLTFQPMLEGLTDMFSAQVVFTETGELFLATANGVWVADGPFQPWSLAVAGLEEPSPSTLRHYASLAPSPDYGADGTVLLAAFEGCFFTTDGAQLWNQVNTYHQQLVSQLAVSPDFAEDRLLLAASPGAGVLAWTVADGVPGAARQPSVGQPSRVATGAPAPGPTPLPGQGVGPTPLPGAAGLASASTGLSSLWSSDMVLSPDFADDGVAFYAYLGLFRSEDRGASWNKLPLPIVQPIVRAVDVSPAYAGDRTVFVGTDGQGVWRSTDAGELWTDVSAGLPATLKARSLCTSPSYATDQTVFLASWASGIWRSTAGGAGWADVSGGIDPKIQALAVSPDFSQDSMLLAAGKPGRLWRSVDAGDSWAVADVGLPFDDSMVVLDIAFSPDYAADRTLAASTGDGAVWLSTDGADSWQLITLFSAGSVRSLAFSPDVANDGLLFAAAPPQLRVLRPFVGSSPGAVVLDGPGLAVPVLRRGEGAHFEVQTSPGWVEVTTPGAFGGSTSRTSTAGAWRALTFYGDGITCFAEKGPGAPLVDLTLDGAAQLPVDLYSASSEPQAAFFSAHFSGPGWHTVRVTHSGQANPQASGFELRADGFETTR